MNRQRIRNTAARLASLILALALVWTGPARADKSVFFVAADQIVLPLSDDTMPFWQDGFLYVSCAIFSDSVGGGAARRNLDISMTQNSDQDRVTLYRGTDSLEFEQGVPFATDQDGTIFYPGAVWRNGRVFVSADLTARFFDLLYSVTAVEHGSLVWLRNPSFRLQERAFVDAAAWQLNNSYQEYVDARSDIEPDTPPDEAAGPDAPDRSGTADRPEAPDRSGTIKRSGSAETPTALETPAENASGTEPPDTAPPEEPETLESSEAPEEPDIPEEPEILEIRGGADLYLCLRAGEGTAALLDTLDGAGIRAAFLCDRAFLEQEGDLARRMAASGHSIGLYLSGTETADGVPDHLTEQGGNTSDSPPDHSSERMDSPPDRLAEAAEDCGRALERAACFRTRLVFMENGTAADRALLRSRGFVCLEQYLDVSDTPPRTANRRERLLREAEALGNRTALWLGDSVTAEDLGKLLDDIQAAEDRCLPLAENTFS